MATEHHETWLTDLQQGSYALLSDADEVDTAVVFVHGFLGDSIGTWLNFQASICSQRAEWSKADAFFFAYGSYDQDITESAEQLLEFINKIFPKPPPHIFRMSEQLPSGLPPILVDLTTHKPTYRHLVLVGHSEGGVVIRRAIEISYGRDKRRSKTLTARLALFAPAHKGVKLSGWIGACMAVGKVDAILMPVLNYSRAFVELRQGNLLDEIESHTADYRQKCESDPPSSCTGFRAHVVFGTKDDVVQNGHYSWDCSHRSERGQDHASICKPRCGYEGPLKFVFDRTLGIEECTG